MNRRGVLCYSGLPTQANNISFEHHNCAPFSPRTICSNGFEVGSVNSYGLRHGLPFRIFEYINVK